MWRKGLALAVSAAVLAACSGGDKNTSNTAADTTSANTAASPGGTASAASAATAKPITGKTWDIKMIGDDKGYRYDPASLTIKVGDGVRFTNQVGGPHNVAFSAEPAASKAQLAANMPAATTAGSTPKMDSVSSPQLVNPNDTYTISFAGVAPGEYDFFCTPHQAMGMKGKIVVQ